MVCIHDFAADEGTEWPYAARNRTLHTLKAAQHRIRGAVMKEMTHYCLQVGAGGALCHQWLAKTAANSQRMALFHDLENKDIHACKKPRGHNGKNVAESHGSTIVVVMGGREGQGGNSHRVRSRRRGRERLSTVAGRSQSPSLSSQCRCPLRHPPNTTTRQAQSGGGLPSSP